MSIGCASALTTITGDDGLAGLGVDSGLLAVVDAAAVDRFLAASEAFCDGSQRLGPAGFHAGDNGILVNTGGDDVFRSLAQVCDSHVHTFQVIFEEGASDARWWAVGQIVVPSGHVLVGDPGALAQYATYPAASPLDACGVWTLLTVPVPAQATVELLKRHAQDPNRAVRVTFRPDGARQGG